MSQLTEALERLMAWYQKHSPEYANSFQPGLSRDDIAAISQSLEVPFPEEVYELYQWRNGTDDDFLMGWALAFQWTPLETMATIYEETRADLDEEDNPVFKLSDGRLLFPLSEIGPLEHLTIIVPKTAQQSHSAVTEMLEGGPSYPLFDSLTSLMQTLADCHDQGLHFLNDEGELECNDEVETGSSLGHVYIPEFLSILRKYNHEALQQAISDIQVLATDITVDYDQRNHIEETLKVLVNYRERSVVEFLESVRDRYPHNPSDAWKTYVGNDEVFEKGLIREKIDGAIAFLRG